MTSNLYENGINVQNSNNQSNLLYLEQLIDRTNHTTNGMSGEMEYQDPQAFAMNYANHQPNQISQNTSLISGLMDRNEVNGDHYSIVPDSNQNRHSNGSTVMLDNFFINTNNACNSANFRYSVQQNAFPEEQQNVNFGQNIILAIQANPQQEAYNTIGNIITLPTNHGNSYEYPGQYITTPQWINNGYPSIQSMDTRQVFLNRNVDRNDRIKQLQQINNGDIRFTKPVFSYSCLIALALKNSEAGSLPVNEIYKYMQENFPYFKTAPDGWKNSVRHNLSLNKAFQKTVRCDASSTQRKGCLWTLKPEKRRSIEKEIRKWFKKHPEAIRRSMNSPENFDSYFKTQMEDSSDEVTHIDTRDGSHQELTTNSSNSTAVNERVHQNFDSAQIYNSTIYHQRQTLNPINEMIGELSNNTITPWSEIQYPVTSYNPTGMYIRNKNAVLPMNGNPAKNEYNRDDDFHVI